MTDHSDDCRGFYVLSEAWYSKRLPEREAEIMVGFYHPDGGTSGEFAIRWVDIGAYKAPRLEVFNDSWETLTHFSDLLQELAKLDGKRPVVDDVKAILIQIGLKDRTERVNPSGKEEADATCSLCGQHLPEQHRDNPKEQQS